MEKPIKDTSTIEIMASEFGGMLIFIFISGMFLGVMSFDNWFSFLKSLIGSVVSFFIAMNFFVRGRL